MELIVQNIWMAVTPSAAKARHSSSINLCLEWGSYFIFRNFKGKEKTLVSFRPCGDAFLAHLMRTFSLCVFNAVSNAFYVR